RGRGSAVNDCGHRGRYGAEVLTPRRLAALSEGTAASVSATTLQRRHATQTACEVSRMRAVTDDDFSRCPQGKRTAWAWVETRPAVTEPPVEVDRRFIGADTECRRSV